MFYIYHAFPLLHIVATQLESGGICSELATDNAGSLAAVNSATLAFLVRAVGAFFARIVVALPIFTEFFMFPEICAVFCPCAPEVEASVRSRNAGLPPGDRVNGWVRARLQPLEIVSKLQCSHYFSSTATTRCGCGL